MEKEKGVEMTNRYDGAKNLRPCRTKEEARERGRRGGLASAAKGRERKRLKELAQDLLRAPSTSVPGLTNAEAMLVAMIDTALAGDVKAFIAVRDTAGEKPVEEHATELSGGLSFAWAKTPEKSEED